MAHERAPIGGDAIQSEELPASTHWIGRRRRPVRRHGRRDGAADLVRLGHKSAELWANQHDGSFAAAASIAWPDLTADEIMILSDVDASGTIDLLRVMVQPDGAPGPSPSGLAFWPPCAPNSATFGLAAAHVRTEWDHDTFNNVIEERALGHVDLQTGAVIPTNASRPTLTRSRRHPTPRATASRSR